MQTESSAGLVMGADMSRPPCREKGLSVVVQQDPRCIAFGVAILFAAQGPDERGQAQTAKDQGYWDQDDKNVHHTLLTRKAFSRTVIDDDDIASAANKGVARPDRAIGMAMQLYAAAMAKF